MNAAARCRHCRNATIRVCLATAIFVQAGCFDWSSLKPSAGGNAGTSGDAASADGDPDALPGAPATPAQAFEATISELEPGQQPYLAAARPFIEAVAKRDYAAAFEKLGPLARAKLSRNQFVPTETDQEFAKHDAAAVENPTAGQFVEFMQQAEATYGRPARLDPPMVETDPEVLSRQDPVLAAYELGNMPDSIPVAHRKAAVQAWVYCRLNDEQVKAAAQEEGINEAEYRRTMDEMLAGGEGPYFKLKTVIIDDGTGPVVGYFELAPPSILD